MGKKLPVQLVQQAVRQVRVVQFEGATDHGDGAVADEMADLGKCEFAEAVIADAMVEGGQQIGRGIGQRAVEIEYDGEVPVHGGPFGCVLRSNRGFCRLQADRPLPPDFLLARHSFPWRRASQMLGARRGKKDNRQGARCRVN